MNKSFLTSKDAHTSIMRRVYAVWLFKKITNPFFVRLYIMGVLLWQLSRSVSVGDILSNVSHINFFDMAHYIADAYIHTDMAVQFYVLLFVATGLWAVIHQGRRGSFFHQEGA